MKAHDAGEEPGHGLGRLRATAHEEKVDKAESHGQFHQPPEGNSAQLVRCRAIPPLPYVQNPGIVPSKAWVHRHGGALAEFAIRRRSRKLSAQADYHKEHGPVQNPVEMRVLVESEDRNLRISFRGPASLESFGIPGLLGAWRRTALNRLPRLGPSASWH